MIKTLIILFAACFSSIGVKAQDSLFVWTENRVIQWRDFMGQASDSSKYDAEVFAEVRYKYEFFKTGKPHFEVYAMFNRNFSWSKPNKQSYDLLKHEQLHFDIAELCALKLKEQFESFKYTENYALEIQTIFTNAKRAYYLTQLQCDEETNHSLNKDKQAEWEAYVNNELKRSEVYLTAGRTDTKN